jgi:hypothetical protein
MRVLRSFDWDSLSDREYITFFNHVVLGKTFSELARTLTKQSGVPISTAQMRENYTSVVVKIKKYNHTYFINN